MAVGGPEGALGIQDGTKERLIAGTMPPPAEKAAQDRGWCVAIAAGIAGSAGRGLSETKGRGASEKQVHIELKQPFGKLYSK
jgi:hypothetical protein